MGDAKDERRSEIPLITTNRINDPAMAEAVIARGDADMVSMARPFLADAEFVNKAAQGRADEINTCIGCNQACLDHIFERKIATCLVNPYACRETELKLVPATTRRKVAVVGAGPAGMACALTAAERGHAVTLFEAAGEIGGQFNLARRIPGKEEFAETLRYFRVRFAKLGVKVRLNSAPTPPTCAALTKSSWPPASCRACRRFQASSIPRSRATSKWSTGRRVGGQRSRSSAPAASASTSPSCSPPAMPPDGHASDGRADDPAVVAFRAEWGIDASYAMRGGLMPALDAAPPRKLWLLQRKGTRSAPDSRKPPAGFGGRC